VRVEIVMAAIDRMSRNPEKMRKPEPVMLVPVVAGPRRR
jgi:hypothetical protein